MFFYTNIFQRFDYLYIRGFENGKRVEKKIKYIPTIWTTRNPNQLEPWHTLDGVEVFGKQFRSIYECSQYIEQNSGIEGIDIFQPPAYVYQYIAETYKGDIVFDPQKVITFNIDIETDVGHRDLQTSEKIDVINQQTEEKTSITIEDFESKFDPYQYNVFDPTKKRIIAYTNSCYAFKGGFPEPSAASEQVNLITIKNLTTSKFVTFGTVPYNGKNANLDYHFYEKESDMLKAFINWWSVNCPDVVTGWNNSLFDNTYLYNRLVLLFGPNTANKLSPWGFTRQVEVDLGGRKATKTYFAGVACLDYLDLYKKFGTYSAKESYSLEAIAQEELKIGKLKFGSIDGTFRLSQGVSAVNIKPLKNQDPEQLADFERWSILRFKVKEELQKRGIND